MKPKRGISSYILLIGLLSMMVVGTFVAYQIWSALTKSQISEAQAADILPLDGAIQQPVLDNLKGRRRFTAADFSGIVFSTGSTGTASASVTQ